MRRVRPGRGGLAARGWSTWVSSRISSANSEHVGALHGAAHPPLRDHGEDPGVHQPGHVAVQAGRWHIRQFGGQGAGGQGPVAEEGLHNPQADGVEQEIRACHEATVAF